MSERVPDPVKPPEGEDLATSVPTLKESQSQDEKSPEARRLAKRLMDQWKEARAWATCFREVAREDRDFYHGDQWTDEQRAELLRQGRPPTVINVVAKAINNLLGRERDSRFNWRALPRGGSDVQAAKAATQALRYVEDATRCKYEFSSAFEDAALGPCGHLEVGYDDSDPTIEPIYIKRVPWDELWWDPYCRCWDAEDARYYIRARILDLDVVLAAWPDKQEEIERAVVNTDSRDQLHQGSDDYGNGSWSDDGCFYRDSDWYDSARKRVRLREHWWWVHEEGQFLRLPDGRTMEFDPADPRQVLGLQAPGAQLVKGFRKRFYYAIMAGDVVLTHAPSPYPYARFPFVPVWAFKTDDREPYGPVRNMKDPQRELNVARSRLNESIRSRWLIAEEGALGKSSIDHVRRDLAKANFVLKVAKLQGVQLGSDKADGQLWMSLQEQAKAEVDDVIGQNEAAYGDKSNEKSGKAIQARVAQQGLNFGALFDHYRAARLLVGEMVLALMQRFYPEAKLARIVEASVIREQGPQADLSWLGEAFAEPITELEFDLIIEDQAESASERKDSMEQALELLGYAPDVLKAQLIPDIIRMSDFEGKEEWAAKAEQALQVPMGPSPGGLDLPPGGPPQLQGPEPLPHLTPQPPLMDRTSGPPDGFQAPPPGFVLGPDGQLVPERQMMRGA